MEALYLRELEICAIGRMTVASKNLFYISQFSLPYDVAAADRTHELFVAHFAKKAEKFAGLIRRPTDALYRQKTFVDHFFKQQTKYAFTKRVAR